MRRTPELIVCGASTGGLVALESLLSHLPQGFAVPLVVVQHRNKAGSDGLCEYLQHFSHLPISEPEDKAPIEAGHVYLAPRDYHLMVEKGHFALSTAAPVCAARPSVNVLFESAADAYAPKVVGVIMTGANSDGAAGLARIKQRGGTAIVQDPATAENRSMPDAALAATRVDRTLALPQIAAFLFQLCHPEMIKPYGM